MVSMAGWYRATLPAIAKTPRGGNRGAAVSPAEPLCPPVASILPRVLQGLIGIALAFTKVFGSIQ